MRTINSSAINIDNTPSTTSSFDTPTSRSTTASARSSAPSTSGQSLDPKRFATGKSPRSPVTPSPQARGRFPSTPVSVAVTSNKRSPSIGYHDRKQQHVLSLTATATRSTALSSLGTDSKMPDSRPRPPHLSAAAAKNVGRTPLTPKIAAKGPTLAVRRSTPNRDEPVVTPRSGGRQSRGESTNTTPNGTPIPDKSHDSWDPRASIGHSKRLSISRMDSGNDDSKFFYASDARGAQPQQQPQQQPSRPPSTSAKPATFFYANSVAAEDKRTQTPPIKGNLTPATSTPPEPAQSKFFYASGAPETSLKPGYQSSGPSSASSSNLKRPTTSSSATGPGHAMPPRPLSPIKMQNPPSILKNSAGPGLANRHHLASPPPLSASAGFSTKRKVSLESAPRSSRGHSRASSIPSLDSTYSPKFTMSPPLHPSEPSSPPVSPALTQPVMTMASLLQAAEEFAEEFPEETEEEEDEPDLQSPTKSTHSSDPVSELVANARRERKVQDLQITNASLEAINRTLERQLRKQSAEIRRFRRLSRAGHLSLEPSTTASRVTSTALSDAPISLSELSEEEPTIMSGEGEEDDDGDNDEEEEEEEEEEDLDSLDDSDMSLEESGSTGETSEHENEKKVVRRHRDERRLRLDLTKHHELLVDSQKINQSLKRCLNWTEVLIKEGQKALEYKVNVADVQFGGHVLAPPDDEETHLDAQLLESLEAGLEAPVQWEKSSQDRDSGIELQAEIV